jgi:hypothetical protein
MHLNVNHPGGKIKPFRSAPIRWTAFVQPDLRKSDQAGLSLGRPGNILLRGGREVKGYSSIMPAKNITELRALLADKFPGLRTEAGPCPADQKVHPAGLPQIDKRLRGGFPKGALSEIIISGNNCGSATLLRALLEQAARTKEIVALIDGSDSFDVARLEESVLARLLWIRCHTAAEAARAADLILRDSNLPLVLFDLHACPESQLRKISASTWYRFQRLVEETGATVLVFTPHRMVAPAQARINLRPQFSLAALEVDHEELLRDLQVEVAEAGKHAEMEFSQFKA